MMFGGSPIGVAVPPTFRAKVCVSRNGDRDVQLSGDGERDRDHQEDRRHVVEEGENRAVMKPR